MSIRFDYLFLAKFYEFTYVINTMKLKYIPLFLLLVSGIALSQEEMVDPEVLTEAEGIVQFDSLQKKNIQIIDSIRVQQISDDLPSTVVRTRIKDTMVFALEDMAKARKYDSIWLNELYNSELFEDVYGLVEQQDYEAVEYEELPTELLKQRLLELNARTPFNIEYNPSLESVIKSYLKNRRKSLVKLMALSDYYFPMFEQ